MNQSLDRRHFLALMGLGAAAVAGGGVLADGNSYADKLPPLFAADKVPDWIQIAPWMAGALNFAKAVEEKFVDLTPYLAGKAVEAYPNLANIASGAWSAGVWNGKLYGIPV